MTRRNLIRMCTLVAASLLAAPIASAQLLGPSAPTGLAALVSAPGEITLSWQPASSVTGITAYRVYHVEADGNLTHVVDVPPEQLSLVEAGIAPGVTLTYVVSALDVLGEGPRSEPASATTWTVPSAPRSIAAASGPGALGESTVSWDAPESDGGTPVLAYHVYRDGALVAQLAGDARAYIDAGLMPLEAHHYQVSAVNAVGEGAASDTACGMPSPWAPELGCGFGA